MTRTRPQARRQQRWPDVMIGVLTLALLGGFGALLLDQRKPPSTATDAAPTQSQATATQPSIPASPGTVAPTDTAAPSTPDTTAAIPAQGSAAQPTQTQTTQGQSNQGQTTPGQSTSAQSSAAPADTTGQTGAAPATPGTTDAATASAPTTTSGGVAQTTEIPPVPKAPDVAPITPPTGVTPQQQQANQQQAAAPDTASTATDSATTGSDTAAGTSVAPRSGGAVTTSENRTPLRSDYRISLGSFSTQATVGTQTANVRSLGYTIHSIDLGDQYVAQVGPFADEATARQALADIQRAYPGALLYRPRGAAASSSASDTSTTSSSSGSSAAPTDSDRAGRTSEAAPSGPTYLQVGAFDRVDSAQKLVGQLRDAGFAPTVNNPPDRKTTVLVGPYSGDALVRAETRLNTAGLDHFRVR